MAPQWQFPSMFMASLRTTLRIHGKASILAVLDPACQGQPATDLRSGPTDAARRHAPAPTALDRPGPRVSFACDPGGAVADLAGSCRIKSWALNRQDQCNPSAPRSAAWRGLARSRLQAERYARPAQNHLSIQEINHRRLDLGCSIMVDNGGSDDGVTAIIESNHQGRFAGRRGTGDRIGPATTLHPRHGDRSARALG